MYHVADFITRIKNAVLARRHVIVMPYSNISLAIGRALVKEGFLESISEEKVDGKKQLQATLRLVRRKSVIHDVKVKSKPSLRIYTGSKDLAKNYNRTVIAILSTNQGIMSGKEAAKKGLGGELLFHIW